MRVVRLADGAVDLDRQEIRRGGSTFTLTTKETELLAYLSGRAGETVSRDDLHREVWGYHANVISRAVDTTVRRLRTKIERDPSNPRHLLTVHGTGYRFEP